MRCLEFDVVILGGGIAGASLFAALAPHLRIALLEREPALAYHTTGRSAAMFAPGYGTPPVQALSRASASFFAEPPPAFGGPLVSRRAMMHVAGPGQIEALIHLAQSRASDRSLRWLNPEEAWSKAPILRRQRLAGALLDSGGADIEVARLHQGYLAQGRAAGGEIFAGLGAASLERRGGVWRVDAGEQAFAAPALVNAAGAWSDEIASMAGLTPRGLLPLSRTVVLTDAPATPEFARWPTVMDVRERFYFRPFAGRLLITGANETPSPPCDAAPDEGAIAKALARFQSACDYPVQRLTARWAGLRTFAPDRVPLIGWTAEAEGFFWFAGQGGTGIQSAPAAASLAAALFLSQPPPEHLAARGVDPAAFSPDRAMGPVRAQAG